MNSFLAKNKLGRASYRRCDRVHCTLKFLIISFPRFIFALHTVPTLPQKCIKPQWWRQAAWNVAQNVIKSCRRNTRLLVVILPEIEDKGILSSETSGEHERGVTCDRQGTVSKEWEGARRSTDPFPVPKGLGKNGNKSHGFLLPHSSRGGCEKIRRLVRC